MVRNADQQQVVIVPLLTAISSQLNNVSADISSLADDLHRLGDRLDDVAGLLYQVVGASATQRPPGVAITMGDVGIGRDMRVTESHAGANHGQSHDPRHDGRARHQDQREHGDGAPSPGPWPPAAERFAPGFVWPGHDDSRGFGYRNGPAYAGDAGAAGAVAGAGGGGRTRQSDPRGLGPLNPVLPPHLWLWMLCAAGVGAGLVSYVV